jgi:hypothetical protein
MMAQAASVHTVRVARMSRPIRPRKSGGLSSTLRRGAPIVMTDMIDDEQTAHHWDTHRVEAFSDGVVAIAITLLVLDINVPSNLHHLGKALERAPRRSLISSPAA